MGVMDTGKMIDGSSGPSYKRSVSGGNAPDASHDFYRTVNHGFGNSFWRNGIPWSLLGVIDLKQSRTGLCMTKIDRNVFFLP